MKQIARVKFKAKYCFFFVVNKIMTFDLFRVGCVELVCLGVTRVPKRSGSMVDIGRRTRTLVVAHVFPLVVGGRSAAIAQTDAGLIAASTYDAFRGGNVLMVTGKVAVALRF